MGPRHEVKLAPKVAGVRRGVPKPSPRIVRLEERAARFV
jgi:hypothetical protein